MPDNNVQYGVTVCIPIFNDWQSAQELIGNIKVALAAEINVRIILVDDGSTEPADTKTLAELNDHRVRIEILHLITNIGHQRAIAIGLSAIQAESSGDIVIVMDGDGEDNPDHLPLILSEMRKHGESPIVFARRNRRTEGWLFRLGYGCFKVLHRVLTGEACNIGNFSVIPSQRLESLTHIPGLWNHYAATVISSRLPVRKVDCPRGYRYAGQSKMDIASLVTHGLRAISVFGETVGVRISMALGALGALGMLGLVIVLVIRLGTDLSIPGWATNATGILLIMCLNFLMLTAISLTFILGARSNTEFIPARDWEIFLSRWNRLDE